MVIMPMSAQRFKPKSLLEFIGKGIVDNPIEKQERVIALLNSLVDDKKNGKNPKTNANPNVRKSDPPNPKREPLSKSFKLWTDKPIKRAAAGVAGNQ